MKRQSLPLISAGNAVNAPDREGISSLEHRISNLIPNAAESYWVDRHLTRTPRFEIRNSQCNPLASHPGPPLPDHFGFAQPLLKGSAAALAVLFSLLGSACQSEYGTILDPLGPVPGMKATPYYANVSTSAASTLPNGTGGLVVATPTGLVYAGSQMYFPHLAYLIESENGWPVRCVPNHLQRTDEVPMEVQLPAGRYILIAEADSLGKVRIPIQITNGMLTKVRLQRFRSENDPKNGDARRYNQNERLLATTARGPLAL